MERKLADREGNSGRRWNDGEDLVVARAPSRTAFEIHDERHVCNEILKARRNRLQLKPLDVEREEDVALKSCVAAATRQVHEFVGVQGHALRRAGAR